ncbi:13063_t:CDS:2, partial [Entrophospora sp. SA101]
MSTASASTSTADTTLAETLEGSGGSVLATGVALVVACSIVFGELVFHKLKNIISLIEGKENTAKDFSPVRDVPHLQRAHTPDEEEEISLYDTFPVHIYKQPVPNPFLVRNKHDHDIDEEDDEFNADLTIVGGKSIDWIISGINIREKLAKYQLDVNPPKTNPEYYDIIFFNLNDEDGFLGTLDKGIVAQMRKEIRRPEVDTNDNMNQEIKSFLKSIIDRDIKKTKENLNHRNAKKIDSFEK